MILGSREQGLRKNILGSWGERSFFFQGAGSKNPPGGASRLQVRLQNTSLTLMKVSVKSWLSFEIIICALKSIVFNI